MNENRRHSTIILVRMINSGLHNIVRNFWLTTAATAVMMITLSILLFSFAANKTLAETIDNRTDDFFVGLYFKSNPEPSLLSSLRSEIEAKDYVVRVTFISEEEARTNFEAQSEDEFISEGLSLFEENILPSSFDIRLNDLNFVDEIVSIAEQPKYSEIYDRTNDSDVSRDSIEQFLVIKDGVNRVSLFGVIIFGAISILIVFNTIRMAVFSRNLEIEIMKLIGATPNYIRGPFLVESALYGIVAALLAFSTVYSVMLSVLPEISSLQSDQTISFFSKNWLLVLLGMMLIGIVIGLLSSWLATAKYLRLKRW
jgi:cell division transport system permease protein